MKVTSRGLYAHFNPDEDIRSVHVAVGKDSNGNDMVSYHMEGMSMFEALSVLETAAMMVRAAIFDE